MNFPIKNRLLILIILFLSLPAVASANKAVIDKWIFSPWQVEEMVSWGDESLVVDFGNNGVWNFDGSWIRLSRWNSQGMTTWGKHQLAVNFGSNGLWTYDGFSWQKIARNIDK